MKPIRDIIVRVPQAYTDRLALPSGFVVYLSTTVRESYDSVRYGEVVAIPDDCELDVEVGDTVFFHQNITATLFEEQGAVDSKYLYEKKDNLYRVPINKDWPLIYARDRKGDFQALNGVCFVKPVVKKKYETTLDIVGNEVEVSQIGTIAYSCNELEKRGITKGDTIVFEKDSEYEFRLNDEKLYCMFERWIYGKVINEVNE